MRIPEKGNRHRSLPSNSSSFKIGILRGLLLLGFLNAFAIIVGSVIITGSLIIGYIAPEITSKTPVSWETTPPIALMLNVCAIQAYLLCWGAIRVLVRFDAKLDKIQINAKL